MATTTTLASYDELKALAYCWRLPELGMEERYGNMLQRRRAILEQSNNPLVKRAWAAIQGGAKGLAAARIDGGPVAEVLTLARGYPMPQALHRAGPAEELLHLATDLQPVMVATFSHFSGDYPDHDHGHECSYTSRAKVGAGGYVASLSKIRMKRARPIELDGKYFEACPACRHEAIMRDCQHIERISLQYADPAGLRFLTTFEKWRKTISAKIRKHNQRKEQRVNYATMPAGDQVVILHDAPDWLGGEPLPPDRPGLYAMVGAWHDDATAGQRSQGLASWGAAGEKETKEKTRRGGNQERPEKCIVTFGHGSYGWLLRKLIEKHKGITAGENATRFRAKQVHIQELLDFAASAGIKYTIEGELPANVTLNAIENKEYCVKRDIEEGSQAKQLEKPEPRPLNMSIIGGLGR